MFVRIFQWDTLNANYFFLNLCLGWSSNLHSWTIISAPSKSSYSHFSEIKGAPEMCVQKHSMKHYWTIYQSDLFLILTILYMWKKIQT